MPDTERILDAIAMTESGGDPSATSPKGARGMFQIMPATARDYGVDPDTLYDPAASRDLARRIVTDHMDRYGGDLRKVGIAYNAGRGRVNQKLLPKETQSWLRRFFGYLGPESAEAAEPRTLAAKDFTPDPVLGEPPSGPLGATTIVGGDTPSAKLRAKGKPSSLRYLSAKDFTPDAPAAESGGPAQSQPMSPDQVLAAYGQKHPYIAAAVKPALTAMEHPYLTAGAIGAVTPPGWAADLGFGGAAAVGAAEQMGYQGIADLATRVGGPWAGFAAGLIAPFASGAVAGRLVGSEAATTAVETAETGAETATRETAETAATKQADVNEAERIRLGAAAAKEAGANQAKIAQAAAEQGAANLDERGAKYEIAEKQIPPFAANLSERAAQARAATSPQAALTQIASEEAERQRTAMLGRTRVESEAAVAPSPAMANGVATPSPETLARGRAFRQAYFDPRERVSAHYGRQYRDFEARLGDKTGDPVPLRKSVGESARVLNSQAAGTEASAPVRQLLARASAMLGRAETEPFEVGRIEQVIQGKSTPSVQAKFTKLLDDYIGAHGQSVTGEQFRDFARQALGGKAATKPTFTELRALRREAQDVAEHAPTDWESHIADQIADAADNSLEHVEGITRDDLNRLHALNAQYHDFKSTWKSNIGAAVSGGNEPSVAMGKMVQNPKLMRELAATATDEEKSHLRNGLADWANVNELSLPQIRDKVGTSVLKGLGFNLPDDAWLKLEPGKIELSTIVNSSPTAQAQFGQAMQEEAARIDGENADLTRREGMALAGELGEAGKPIRAALFQATTPQQVHQAAAQLAQMKPEDVVMRIAAAQKTPGQAAFEQSLVAKRAARERFTQAMRAQGTPDQAAIQAVQDLPTKGEAGRKALLNLKPSKGEEGLQRFLKFRLMWYTSAIIGTGLATGHVAPYAIGMAAIDGVMSSVTGTRAMARAILRYPRVAELAYQAIKNPKGLTGMRVAGKAAAGIIAAVNAEKARERQSLQDQEEDRRWQAAEGAQ